MKIGFCRLLIDEVVVVWQKSQAKRGCGLKWLVFLFTRVPSWVRTVVDEIAGVLRIFWYERLPGADFLRRPWYLEEGGAG